MKSDRRKFLRRLTIVNGVPATGVPSFAETFGVSDDHRKIEE